MKCIPLERFVFTKGSGSNDSSPYIYIYTLTCSFSLSLDFNSMPLLISLNAQKLIHTLVDYLYWCVCICVFTLPFREIPVSCNLDLYTSYLIYFTSSSILKSLFENWNQFIEIERDIENKRKLYKRADNYINAIYIIKIMYGKCLWR